MSFTSTKIHLLLENQFNLLEKSTYLGMFNHSETPVIYLHNVFLYIQNYVLSLKNSKIKILFCQALRPQCIVRCIQEKYIPLIFQPIPTQLSKLMVRSIELASVRLYDSATERKQIF